MENYILLKKLGGGRFSDVYSAKRKDDGEIVAVKTIKNLRYFRRELFLHMKCSRTKYVIDIIDNFSNIDTGYIVMKHMTTDLFSLIYDAMPPYMQYNCLKSVGKALKFCHSQGVLHMDVKPENILVDGDSFKLADFGLSRKIKDEKVRLCGTIQYMSPEMISNNEITEKHDAWSYGILVYEVFTGTQCFSGQNKYDIITKIAKVEINCDDMDDIKKDLVSTLVVKDVSIRSTVNDALKHSYFTSFSEDLK